MFTVVQFGSVNGSTELEIIATFADRNKATKYAANCDERKAATLVVYSVDKPDEKKPTAGSQVGIFDRLLGFEQGPDLLIDETTSDVRSYDEFEAVVDRDSRVYGGDIQIRVSGAHYTQSKYDAEYDDRGPRAGSWTGIHLYGEGSIQSLIRVLKQAQAVLYGEKSLIEEQAAEYRKNVEKAEKK
jgi:hypothetical protein